jgi:hypothetical protein
MQDYHFPPEKDRFNRYKKVWAGEEVKEEAEVAETEVSGVSLQTVLAGLRHVNLKVHLMSESVRELPNRSKYARKFDVIVLGVGLSGCISAGLNAILKPAADVWVESLK